MKALHMVLRGAGRRRTRGLGQPGPAEALETAATAPLQVQIESLQPRDADRLRQEPDVQAVAPAMPMRLIEPRVVEIPALDRQQGIAWGVRAVGADRSTCNGEGVVVAVLDTGIQADHPAFDGVELVCRNFTDEVDGDTHGHGTHCAGTVFGRPVDGMRIGVATGVRKALIGKVLGDGGSSIHIVQAMRWAADNGAQVLSMSLGMDFNAFEKRLRTEFGMPRELAFDRALQGYRDNLLLFDRVAAEWQLRPQPALVVAASGNESRRELSQDFELAVCPPANTLGFISVGALGQGEAGLGVADFSNTGASVSAPGVAVASAALGGGLRASSGTSMATPHVAGVAALWAQWLRQRGMLNLLNLSAKLVGGAETAALRAGIDAADVGAGLVIAPRN